MTNRENTESGTGACHVARPVHVLFFELDFTRLYTFLYRRFFKAVSVGHYINSCLCRSRLYLASLISRLFTTNHLIVRCFGKSEPFFLNFSYLKVIFLPGVNFAREKQIYYQKTAFRIMKEFLSLSCTIF